MSDLLSAARAALPGLEIRQKDGRTSAHFANKCWYLLNDSSIAAVRSELTARRDALTAALGDGWVPVSERLPALDRDVPLWTDRGLMYGSRGGADGDGDGWLWADQYGDAEAFADVVVLKWLDLQPPKGVTL